MKLTKNELLEKINNLNKQKPLKENKEIQRVASPADADALEQHEEALKQNKERLNAKNYAKDVKDLIEETASEESRYRHFDVVDRRDLAKRINEAKEKGLYFKVSRSAKQGFRYNLEVLNEEFMKKDAGDPDISCAAFNKATDVQASGPAAGLGEDVEEIAEIKTPAPVEEDGVDYKGLVAEICCWLTNNEDVEGVSFPLIDHLVEIGYDEDFVNGLFENCIEKEKSKAEYDTEELEDVEEEFPLEENLDEELKVYTSTLENFHPSISCEDFWNEIVEADKVEDLEYALETLYPNGISDVALDDLLSHEEDWIRDIIELPYEESEEDEDEIVDDSDEEIIDGETEVDEKETENNDSEEDFDDIEPIEFEDDDTEKELKEESLENKPKDTKEIVVECDEADDDKVQSLANGFINKNFKENNCCENDLKDDVKKQLTESEESNDEIVDISEDDVDNMLGCPKKDKEK